MSSLPLPGADLAPGPEGRPTWRELLERAGSTLGDRQAARWLLEEAAGRRLSALLSSLDDQAPPAAAAALEVLVRRRQQGEPLQHVFGHWPFAGVELLVDRRALVPRPETEVLVELALGELRGAPRGARASALDLGTGSGAIACALVQAIGNLQVLAVDCSARALALAEENRGRLPSAAAVRLRLARGSWYEGLPAELAGRLDLVAANPPYLAAAEWPGLDPVVRDHDPYQALVAGPTGLEAHRAVLAGAGQALRPGGTLLLEHAPHQAGALTALARQGGARSAEVLADLAGRPRVLRARW